MKTLFQNIKDQILNNEVYGKAQEFKFRMMGYPEKAIVWLTTKAKVFKVAKVEVSKLEADYRYTYTIHYKECNVASDFLCKAYEAMMYKKERAEKKGYSGEFANEMITTKFNHINDKYRVELDCPNYENRNNYYEYLDKADDCTFELFIQSIGYENYQDFVVNQEAFQTFTDEDVDRLYREFLERIESREYAQGYIY